MKDPIIDESEILHFEPEYRIWGMVIKNEKHGKRLIFGAIIAITCGMIGLLGLIAMLSYIYL